MSSVLKNLIDSFELGSPSSFRNMGVIPLLGKARPVIEYFPLSEALSLKLVLVTELTQTGSVPELKIRNLSDKAVLALDGEEMVGAKQNRVLNTSILLKKQTETVIPVSCTEHGRWSYSTPEFHDSGNVLFRSARASKSVAVSDSLSYSRRFDSNQGEIWNSISSLNRQANIDSPTGAMNDFFTARSTAFADYLKAFPCQNGQCGLLVLIDGCVAGFDYVSMSGAYSSLHAKLLKSYAVESLLTEKPGEYAVSTQKAAEFLERLEEITETKFKSPGHGWDHRFRGASLVGSVLAYRGQAVHAAFFSNGDGNGQSDDRMSSLKRRMGFRG